MRIKSVRGYNVLSFDEFELRPLHEYPNIIVGPNNSGKTNVVRLLAIARDAILWLRKPSGFYRSLLHYPSNPWFRIEIDVELDESERDLVHELLDEYVVQEFRGPPWELLGVHKVEKGRGEEIERLLREEFRRALPQALTGLFSSFTVVVELRDPDHLPEPYVITRRDGLEVIVKDGAMHSPTLPKGTWRDLFQCYYEQSLEILRNSVADYVEGRSSEPPRITLKSEDLLDVLRKALASTSVGEPSIRYERLSAHRRGSFLERVRSLGLEFGHNVSLSLSRLLLWMYASKLRVLGEVRSRPLRVWPLKIVEGARERPHVEGPGLYLDLFKLQTSPDPRDHEVYLEVRRTFRELLRDYGCEDFVVSASIARLSGTDERQLSPYERVLIHGSRELPEPLARALSALLELLGASRELLEEPVLELEVHVKVGGRYVPLELMGAGVMEVLNVLTAVAGCRGCVVVLDEPALHLHPSLQERLASTLQRLAEESGNQLLVVTHSPYLVPPTVLGKVWRIYMEGGATRAVGLNELEEVIKSLERKPLILNQLRTALFARKVVLCEGHHEYLLLLHALASELDLLEVVLVNCEGKDNIPDVAETLEKLRIPYLVFCDEDARNTIRGRVKDDHIVSPGFHDLTDVVLGIPELREQFREQLEQAKRDGKVGKKIKRKLKIALLEYVDLVLEHDKVKKVIGEIKEWASRG